MLHRALRAYKIEYLSEIFNHKNIFTLSLKTQGRKSFDSTSFPEGAVCSSKLEWETSKSVLIASLQCIAKKKKIAMTNPNLIRMEWTSGVNLVV